MTTAPTTRAKDTQRRFARLMAQNARRWRRAVDEELKPHGLTEATWLPLLHLGRAGAPMLQKELAHSLTLDSSSVVRLLDALEASGHVTRSTTEDRRAKAVCLTPLGRRTVVQVEAATDATRRRYLVGVSLEELETAVRVLEKVAAALAATQDPGTE
ncbi:MAG TPA: MarR family transcriptional regulator [Burkholderiaceae bacterium]|jgi:MarR family transcriptional regulator for hemolysin